jgi:hypothetical protein
MRSSFTGLIMYAQNLLSHSGTYHERMVFGGTRMLLNYPGASVNRPAAIYGAMSARLQRSSASQFYSFFPMKWYAI